MKVLKPFGVLAAIVLVVLGIGGAIAGGSGVSVTVLMLVILGLIAFYRTFISLVCLR